MFFLVHKGELNDAIGSLNMPASSSTVAIDPRGLKMPNLSGSIAIVYPSNYESVFSIGKGAAACAVGAVVAGPAGAHLAGTAAVTGHCYPVWTGFRGGKGVATSVGQCLATFPAYFPIDAAVAVVTVAAPGWRQRAFATTVVSSVCWVLGGVVWWRRGLGNLWGPSPTAALPAAAAMSGAVIIGRFVAAGRAAPLPKANQPTATVANIPIIQVRRMDHSFSSARAPLVGGWRAARAKKLNGHSAKTSSLRRCSYLSNCYAV